MSVEKHEYVLLLYRIEIVNIRQLRRKLSVVEVTRHGKGVYCTYPADNI